MTQHRDGELINRTGVGAAPELAEQMIAGPGEFPPSSEGSAQALAEVRVTYAQQTEIFEGAKAAAGDGASQSALIEPGRSVLLMDKLGERLAFEHAGARLYEALVSKHRAYGDFAGGPGAEDLMQILGEEYEHAAMLEHAIAELGGDPTALTPSANLATNVSAGLPQVLTDPRTNLLQCLEAIVVAELADNECWTVLNALAREAGHEELAATCQQAIAHERDHLRKVRRWIAAGHGRSAEGENRSQSPDTSERDATEEEFTFSKDSPVDREGYVISDEEARETGATQSRATQSGATQSGATQSGSEPQARKGKRSKG
jgi:rubrerythrin